MKDKPLVVVFGCAGYIGNYMARYLISCGYRVHGVDNFWKGHGDALLGLVSNPDFTFKFGDVTNDYDIQSNLEGADYIINLAGIVGFPACKRHPVLAKAVNQDAAIRIAQLKRDKVPLFFASTGSVYGKVEDICTEESPTNPQSLYGVTKLNAEHEIAKYYPNTLIYRFATAFGVSPCMRVNLLVNDLVYQAMTNRSIAIFQADFRRTFIHISDFCRSVEFGLDNISSLKYNIYNVGSPENNWTKRQLAEYIKVKTGCSLFYNDVGEDLDQRDYEVDYSKIYAEGFECKVTMAEGIDELIKATPILQIRHQYE